MRTTLAIADDILVELKALALARKISLTRVTNETLRVGLAAEAREQIPRRYRQRVFELGEPLVPLDRALRIAAALEDEEVIRKLETGK